MAELSGVVSENQICDCCGEKAPHVFIMFAMYICDTCWEESLEYIKNRVSQVADNPQTDFDDALNEFANLKKLCKLVGLDYKTVVLGRLHSHQVFRPYEPETFVPNKTSGTGANAEWWRHTYVGDPPGTFDVHSSGNMNVQGTMTV